VLEVVTNDLERSAVDIAALYKARWQIELLFRWIMHLKLSRFLDHDDFGLNQSKIMKSDLGSLV